MAAINLDGVAFPAHVELLQMFLLDRDEIVERIAGVLNAQRMPAQYLQDAALLSRQFENCFFSSPAINSRFARLRGELQAVHWASGFRPRSMPGMHNDLVDPAQMMIRGFYLWQRTRWPGRNGRIRYAHTLFIVYLIRCLELLSMRLWDAGSEDSIERLAQVQRLLDDVWRGAPENQPVLLRDARWLIPLAQSPTTDDLSPYFDVVEHISGSLREADGIEVFKAAVVMAGGHLRSQLRHQCMKQGLSIADRNLVLTSRNSNALDFAVLIQGLVALLERYEKVLSTGDMQQRLELASVICQGISVDPELFVNRSDLLGAYSMIEHLFCITDPDGVVVFTPKGRRHMDSLRSYAEHIDRVSTSLLQDCRNFKPAAGSYSPYGIIYGFSSNLTEHMALKSLQPGIITGFSLEDVFCDGNPDKLAWVSGWRKLPHVDQEMQRLFDYPQGFAAEVFDRLERALRRLAAEKATSATTRTGRLFVVSDDERERQSAGAGFGIADLPAHYIGSSDPHRVASGGNRFYEPLQLLRDRHEGMFLVSYETRDGWVAVSKDVLTDVLAAGRDARIAGLPRAAVGTLRLMYPGLVVVASENLR